MTNKHSKYIFFFLLFLYPFCLSSQEIVNLAIVRIDSIRVTSEQQLEFDVKLIRISDRWDAFANASIEIGFVDSNFVINENNLEIAYIPESSEIEGLMSGPQPGTFTSLPTTNYYMTPRVVPGRISITISGPKFYDDCQIYYMDEVAKVGRFSILSKNGNIPYKLKFIKPYFYYQAIAYKLLNDSIKQNITFFNANDNVEMEDSADTRVIYEIDDREPDMIDTNFRAVYAGKNKVRLLWETISEPPHKGFILRRRLIPYFENIKECSEEKYDHLVGEWDSGISIDDTLIGNIIHMDGHIYEYEFDVIDYRDEAYCYQLWYEDMQGEEYFLDTAYLEIPDVLIYEANATENPFKESTTIFFRLEEDSFVDISVYDMEGRLVKELCKNKSLTTGMWGKGEKSDENFLTFYSSPYAQQGVYNVIIIARPQFKMNIKTGRAVVKLQFVRE